MFGEVTNFQYEVLTNEKQVLETQLANEKTEEKPQFANYLQEEEGFEEERLHNG